MLKKHLETISKNILFSGIKPEEITKMLDCFQPRLYEAQKSWYIVTNGEDCEELGILLEGEAAVCKENPAGNRVVIIILKPADVFGEVVAFSSHNKWPATVEALEDCKVLFIKKKRIVEECEKMCPWHRKLIYNYLKIISEKAIMLNKKVEYLTIKSTRGRVCTYLLERYKKTEGQHIRLPLNRNELADYLNIARPSLSRELCRLRNEGVIDFHLTMVRILDIEALKLMSVQEN